ncbi:GTP-binding protein [Aeropyrum pernix]|uniref:GTP-binding protein n=1 Tax=Aeropyrum pernix TaxID=56636 RepID=A0A401H9T3_AERPX|nr:GTP-binding protein [Aeropyrum pernix]GBF09177.1 GTP-binding protein [Aeropyrum pernix]
MPANLPPEAKAKLAKYSDARSVEEKIQALEEFISAVPKHKGTENLLLWARKRLAELREELEEKRKKRVGGGPSFFVEKSGAGQAVLIGPPNSGKSSILAALTNAKPEVADYPFTTRMPRAGMLPYEDIQFQIVDTPPLLPGSGSSVNNRVLGLARNADAIILVFSLDDPNLVETIDAVVREVEDRGIVITRRRGLARIMKSREVTGVRIEGPGRLTDATEDDVRRLLSQYRIYNAIVYIEGDVSLDDVESAVYINLVRKPALAILNKADLPGAREAAEPAVKRLGEIGIDTIVASALKGDGLGEVAPRLFRMLDIVRVYTKQPNKEPDKEPLVLHRGSTVMDVAKHIHKDLVRRFKYARVWGKSVKYPGQRVGPEHVVEDGDIVEIHVR